MVDRTVAGSASDRRGGSFTSERAEREEHGIEGIALCDLAIDSCNRLVRETIERAREISEIRAKLVAANASLSGVQLRKAA